MILAKSDMHDMVQILLEALGGADPVVIESRNALGKMDAHYLHAPSILEDLIRYTQELD